MLTINLQQIIQDINNRRNHVRYEFQELGLMLTEKLSDPRHKALYMKLAKNEEQELLMDAMHFVLATPNASGNLGPLFMWKLKELKERPLEPLGIRYEIPEGYFRVGVIAGLTRGDMPLLLAGVNTYQESFCDELSVSLTLAMRNNQLVGVVAQPFPHLKETLNELLTEFKRKPTIALLNQWLFKGDSEKIKSQQTMQLKGLIKFDVPVLTKQVYGGKMPRN